MFQTVKTLDSVQIDVTPQYRTSLQTLRRRIIDQSKQAQPVTPVQYRYNDLQGFRVWKYTYPVGVTPLVSYTAQELSTFPFQSSTRSRSGTFLQPQTFKEWRRLSVINQGPLSDADIDYGSISANQGIFLKSYNKTSFLDSMLQYYSQNQPINFKVLQLPSLNVNNRFALSNKQFVRESYDRMTFIYRFYLRSINERFKGKQNLFTSTLPPQRYFDSYSLVTFVQPLSIWVQGKDMFINFSTQFQSQKNNLIRIKIPDVDTIFTKDRLNTIILSYNIGQPVIVYINGIKFSPVVAQTGQTQDGQEYQVLLYYKNTVGQYQFLGIMQTQFSMRRQQISAYAYLFGNRPQQQINAVDKYYQFKTVQNSLNAKQFQTHFGKWYNQFIIAQNNDNLQPRDVFRHSFKDMLMLGRQLTQRQIDQLNGRSPVDLLSNFPLLGGTQILILDQVTTTSQSSSRFATQGAVWNQQNFVYNQAQWNEAGFTQISQDNQNLWIFYGDMIYQLYRNSLINYQGDNILYNVRFSQSNFRFAQVIDFGYVSKKNGILIFTNNIFNDATGYLKDYIANNDTYYTDMLRQRNIYKKVYICQTTQSYLGQSIGVKYVTKVGLYNKFNQLLAVGSVSKPLQLNQNQKASLKVKLEF